MKLQAGPVNVEITGHDLSAIVTGVANVSLKTWALLVLVSAAYFWAWRLAIRGWQLRGASSALFTWLNDLRSEVLRKEPAPTDEASKRAYEERLAAMKWEKVIPWRREQHVERPRIWKPWAW